MNKSRKTIAHIVAVLLISIGFALAVIFSKIEIYRDFVKEKNRVQHDIETVLKVSHRSATVAAFSLSETIAKEVVLGLIEYDFINAAEIIDDLGNTLAKVQKPTVMFEQYKWFLSVLDLDEQSKTFSESLFEEGMKSDTAAQLNIHIDYTAAYAPFLSRLQSDLFARALEIAVLVLLFYYFFHKLITLPIIRLSSSISNIKLGEQSSRVAFIEGHENNEIGNLVHSTNNLIRENERYIEQVKNSEIKFRNIVEGSLQGIFIHDNFKPLFANQICADIFGYSNSEDILAMESLLTVLYPSDEQSRIERYADSLVAKKEISATYECQALKHNGSLIWLEHHVTIIEWEGKSALQCVVVDISERKKISQELSYNASHDVLTGLINRRAFEQQLETVISEVKHDLSTSHAVFFMDLDQFKVVNDTSGHGAGDILLQQLSVQMKQAMRHSDTLARLGGDEFGVLLRNCSLEQAQDIALNLLKIAQDFRFNYHGNLFKIGISIGVVPITSETTDLSTLMSHADAACYQAKDNGRNRIHVSTKNDRELAQRQGQMKWVNKINYALENDLFCLYAQAIESLEEDKHRHYELLIRLKDEDNKIIGPYSFLPAAERYDLISNIDFWVIKYAFNILEHYPHLDNEKSCFFSINLSGPSLSNELLLDFICEQINTKKVSSEMLCFEITETAAISNISNARNFISTLKELGCSFALDDFGSGLSSFGYLKNLPVDYLKIDGMFVKDILHDPIDNAMVKSINEVGQVLGMKTIAEFVENDDIKNRLKQIGINYGQGYGIHKPEPFSGVLANLQMQNEKGLISQAVN